MILKVSPILIVVWHGVIFVRDKIYKNGIFKFVINFPTNYPLKIPEVFFITPIIHPYVQENSGKVDLTKKFTKWESGKNYSIQLIYFLQELFYQESFLTDDTSFNPTVAYNAKQDFKSFSDKIKLLVEENNKNKNKKDEKSLINFDLNVNNEEIKDRLLNKNKDLDPIDRIEEFKNWFFNNFTDQLLRKTSNNNNV